MTYNRWPLPTTDSPIAGEVTQEIVYSIGGELTAAPGVHPYYASRDWVFDSIRVSLGEPAEGGDGCIIQVVLNDYYYLDYVILPAGDRTILVSNPMGYVGEGDYIKVDVIDVGSSFAGSGLVVQIQLVPGTPPPVDA